MWADISKPQKIYEKTNVVQMKNYNVYLVRYMLTLGGMQLILENAILNIKD